MLLGKYGKWMWLTSRGTGLHQIADSCPQLVVDRFVIVSAFDAGLFKPSKSDPGRGWTKLGKAALSPRIASPEEIPAAEHDEWYVFCSPPEAGIEHVFVKYPGFRLTLGHVGLHEMQVLPVETQFWKQLETVKPMSYIASGDNLVFVTGDHYLYESVALAVQESEWRQQEAEQTNRTKLPSDRGT